MYASHVFEHIPDEMDADRETCTRLLPPFGFSLFSFFPADHRVSLTRRNRVRQSHSAPVPYSFESFPLPFFPPSLGRPRLTHLPGVGLRETSKLNDEVGAVPHSLSCPSPLFPRRVFSSFFWRSRLTVGAPAIDSRARGWQVTAARFPLKHLLFVPERCTLERYGTEVSAAFFFSGSFFFSSFPFPPERNRVRQHIGRVVSSPSFLFLLDSHGPTQLIEPSPSCFSFFPGFFLE